VLYQIQRFGLYNPKEQINMLSKTKKLNSGFVALIFVIMVTSLFIVSSVIIAMVNTSNNMANYHVAESDDVMYNIDACLSDAMWQIASSTSASGDYSISNVGGITCVYQISATASGLKTVTSTATTTSDVGSWNRSVVMRVNVSSSPFFIQSHKDYLAGTCLNNSCCDDGVCNATETCSTCSADCGTCPVCGNGTPETGEDCDDGNAINTDDCLDTCVSPSCGDTFTWAGHEACDDGNAINTDDCLNTCVSPSCGDTFIWAGHETCEFTDESYYCEPRAEDWCGNCVDSPVVCPSREDSAYFCHQCVSNRFLCTGC
jgi:cysteine-rich repeat protein